MFILILTGKNIRNFEKTKSDLIEKKGELYLTGCLLGSCIPAKAVHICLTLNSDVSQFCIFTVNETDIDTFLHHNLLKLWTWYHGFFLAELFSHPLDSHNRVLHEVQDYLLHVGVLENDLSVRESAIDQAMAAPVLPSPLTSNLPVDGLTHHYETAVERRAAILPSAAPQPETTGKRTRDTVRLAELKSIRASRLESAIPLKGTHPKDVQAVHTYLRHQVIKSLPDWAMLSFPGSDEANPIFNDIKLIPVPSYLSR